MSVAIFSVISAEQQSVLNEVNKVAQSQGVTLLLVGGIIRDSFYNIPSKDVDLIVQSAQTNDFIDKLSLHFRAQSEKHERFLTAKILMPNSITCITELDFVTPRRERYPHPGSLPLVEIGDIESDLKRRDFSINAVAVPLEQLSSLINAGGLDTFRNLALDLCDGVNDLDKRIIRVLHERSFIDDPTRILRAFRYKQRISGQFDSETAELIEQARSKNGFNTISAHRRLLELRRVFTEMRPDLVLNDLSAQNLLSATALFPGDKHQEFVKIFSALYVTKHNVSLWGDDKEKIGLAVWLYIYGEQAGGKILKSAGITRKRLVSLGPILDKLKNFL